MSEITQTRKKDPLISVSGFREIKALQTNLGPVYFNYNLLTLSFKMLIITRGRIITFFQNSEKNKKNKNKSQLGFITCHVFVVAFACTQRFVQMDQVPV